MNSINREFVLRTSVGLLIISVLSYVLYQFCRPEQEHGAKSFPVEVGRFDIIDDSEGDNKDGRVNPGEKVKIRFYLKNTGPVTLPKSTATLFTSQGGIDITDSVATFPAIAPDGDAVASIDTFAFWVADTVTASSVAFCLTGTFSPEGYEATAFVPIYTEIYANINSVTISTSNVLEIKLSICNNTGFDLVHVAAEIPSTTTDGIHDGNHTLAFTALSTKVLYGTGAPPTISNSTCVDPLALPSEKFRYQVSGALSNGTMICFPVKIYTGASINVDGSIDISEPTGARHRKTVDLVYQIP